MRATRRGSKRAAVAVFLAAAAVALGEGGVRAASIPTGAGPGAIAGSESDPLAVVVNEAGGSVSVIHTGNQAETGRFTVMTPTGPVGPGILKDIAYLDGTGLAYTVGIDGNVCWVHPGTGASGVLASLSGAAFVAVAAPPSASVLYALDASQNRVVRVTTAGAVEIVGTVAAGARDIDLTASGAHAVVSSSNAITQTSTISVVHLSTGAVVSSLGMAEGANRVCVAGNTAYVTRLQGAGQTDLVVPVDITTPGAAVLADPFDSGGAMAAVDARGSGLYISTGTGAGVRLAVYSTVESATAPAEVRSRFVGATANGTSQVCALVPPQQATTTDLVVVTDLAAGTIHIECPMVVPSSPPTAEGRSGPTLVTFDDDITMGMLEDHDDYEILVEYDGAALLDLTEAQYAWLLERGAILDDLSGRQRISLTVAEFDAPVEPALPPVLKSAYTGEGWYIVQFVGPIKDAWRVNLEAQGIVVGYLPTFAYLVKLTEGARQTVDGWPEVHWVGPYHPAYRLDPALGDGQMVVQFFPNHVTTGIAAVTAAGFTVLEQAGVRARVQGTVAMARTAALSSSVMYLSAYHAPEPFNNAARTCIAANVPQGNGVDGRASNQVVAVTDSGLYTPHEVFSEPGKLLAPLDFVGDILASNFGDTFGHGTFVGCSAIGDSPAYLAFNNRDGVAYGARGISVKVFNNAGVWGAGIQHASFWSQPYSLGARVNCNAWGTLFPGYGNPDDQVADEVTWANRDYVLVAAAGNGGAGGAFAGRRQVASPGQAKNPISVGAVSTGNPANVWGGSSRGPATDGRRKPEVMAPGDPIVSALVTAGPTGYGSFFSTRTGTTLPSGTSYSTGIASGAAALVRDYFQQGFYPTGSAVGANGFTPSAALVKAVLVNGGRECTGTLSDANNEGTWPNTTQGWGAVHLDDSLFFTGDSRTMVVWDGPASLAPQSSWASSFEIATGTAPVEVTLTWTDHPSNPAAFPNINNDLDLMLTAPDGTIFRGNRFANARNPGFSLPGSTGGDRLNTVESVQLVPNRSVAGPLPRGAWRIQVTAFNMPNPTSNFAVVVTGDVAPPDPQSIAVVGDFKGALKTLIESRIAGATVRSYTADNIAAVLRDLASTDVVVLNHAMSTIDVQDLIEAADMNAKGLVFMGSYYYQLWHSPLQRLKDAENDPTTVSQHANQGPVKVTMLQNHAVFQGFTSPATLTLVDGGDYDYQTYDGYTGTNLATNAVVVGGNTVGDAYSIGIRDQSGQGGGRHALLGALGASAKTSTPDWTEAGRDVFINAVRWARNAQDNLATPVEVAVVGDFEGYIAKYLRYYGYRVSEFAPDECDAVASQASAFDVVLVNRAASDSELQDLLDEAAAAETGIVFLGRGGYGTSSTGMYGIDALSDLTGSPSSVGWDTTTDWVSMRVDSASHPVFDNVYWEFPSLSFGSTGGSYRSWFGGWDGTNIGSRPNTSSSTAWKMAGVKDRSETGGARHVLLASCGMGSSGHSGWWFRLYAGKIVRNALQWAKKGAP